MTLTKGMIVLAIIVAVSGAVVGNPVTFLDGMTQRMLDREAAIGRGEHNPAPEDCTIENKCVNKGDPGTYPDEATMAQRRQQVVGSTVAVGIPPKPQERQLTDDQRQVQTIGIAMTIFVIGLLALGGLMASGSRRL